jgi:predicted dehydrogenase
LESFGLATYQRETLVGTRGTLDIPQAFTPARTQAAPVVVYQDAHEGVMRPVEPADHYALMAGQFMDAVRQNSPVPYALETSRAVLRVLLALAAAARSGERQMLEW